MTTMVYIISIHSVINLAKKTMELIKKVINQGINVIGNHYIFITIIHIKKKIHNVDV